MVAPFVPEPSFSLSSGDPYRLPRVPVVCVPRTGDETVSAGSSPRNSSVVESCIYRFVHSVSRSHFFVAEEKVDDLSEVR